MKIFLALFACVGLALAAAFALGQPAAMSDKTFAKEVAPLLQKRCLNCHNPEKSRGSLDLSTRAALLEGGEKGPGMVPGDSKNSLLVQLVRGPAPKMPRQADPLSPVEVDLLARWIDAGAPWPKEVVLHQNAAKVEELWWAIQPLHKPELPKVSAPSWCKTPLDHFVLAKMDAKGLKPGPAADRATFIRRVTFDLTGLPPTPEEIDDFIKDSSAQAFEKLVDRLLASTAYGERWARIWLDLVHYADTHGFDKDKRRLFAWRYRDWVIRAFNRDMPYRPFIHYQVAGDVLFPMDPEGIIASGFVVAGPWDFVGQVELREGTVDKEKTRTLDRDDMVSNTMSTFCSLTIHCARCHDHKFDPIPMKEYYGLQAVFAGVERGDRPVATLEAAAHQAKLEKQRQAARARHEELVKQAAQLTSPVLAKITGAQVLLREELAGLPSPAPTGPSPSNGYHSSIEPRPDALKWVQVDLGQKMPLDVIRLIPARPTDFADTPGFGFPVRFQVAVSDDPQFKNAEILADQTKADFANPGDAPVCFAAEGKEARYIRVTAHRLWKRSNDYVFALAELQALSRGQNVALNQPVTSLDTIDSGRWHRQYLVDHCDSRKYLPAGDDPRQRKRLSLETRLAVLEKERQRQVDMLVDPATRKAIADAALQVESIAAQIKAAGAQALVYAPLPIPPRPIHLLTRGDVERKGELIEPGALRLLADMEHHFKDLPPGKEGPRRAALAHWIADDKNVLTWRSIVNRVWQSHFGKGLVDTPSDFGKNGSKPTHPELLDYLAADFRDQGDSFKRLHKLIVLSATYRQSSADQPAFARIDGDNRFLWRMNRQRLDAESLRDSTLAVAGKLDRTMFGPGYQLFRFKDDHSPIYDHLDLAHLNDPATHRRTVYRFVPRSVPNPFLECLDCADPNINVPVRNTTLTALQALALLNDPFMIRQAENFAARLQALDREPEKQVENAYRLALGRLPAPGEKAAFAAYLRRHGLANGCRVLLNSNEFLFVD